MLAVRVPSRTPAKGIWAVSAFEDMIRAQTILYVMRDAGWVKDFLAERTVQLHLTDEFGMVWWAVQPDKVAWPDTIAFPIPMTVKSRG